MPSEIRLDVVKRCVDMIDRATIPDTEAAHHLVRRFLSALHALRRADRLHVSPEDKSGRQAGGWTHAALLAIAHDLATTDAPLSDDSLLLGGFYLNAAVERVHSVLASMLDTRFGSDSKDIAK